MKINLTVLQKIVFAFVCFAAAIVGFMVKLPAPDVPDYTYFKS